MEKEGSKFSVISEIFIQFTEENKEKLLKTAKTLLKVQKEDNTIPADTPYHKEKKNMV